MGEDKQKRFLIIRPDRIGDVVLSTPIPRELKKMYPNSFVAVLLRDYTKDIYQNNPHVDDVIIDLGKKELRYKFQLIKQICSHSFTHAFMLLPTERMSWILFFAGVKYRIGVGHKFYQFLTNAKSVYRRKYIPLRHEADYCMDMARKIGVETYNLDTEIFLSQEEMQQITSLREKFGAGEQVLIGVHSTSGISSPNWKPSAYCELIVKLKSLHNVRVVITDLLIPDEIREIEGVIYPEQKDLRDLIKIISNLDLMVTSSTGPMHIAGALKVPTISLFCPLPACSPELWGPKGNKAINILPDENYCGVVCSGNPKQCYFEGVGGISVERVFNEVKGFINQKNITT
ncbi:MAG: ADP-heptose--LPS heptosyltransferase [Ignavibacteria bacterium RIFOXYB2_FULL_35_12]|nr:MAG: ADP-heptose--LPS heptosyltransferase [Ignavibacteria bacterium GWC2_35_8]OGU56653.1 MAG: ADP-heptose--LPS heptosyltransferase [Ignavibacteria bacterium GWF2_35_20]OGU81820.1 MAG: ADP-heptose--LPS heptosyltransferase [Ignavibacteria bacterium RIFOXYA2_FULL_35_9]OGU86362.1 MAG: ADP-heptose--LPS heptosyltransferase [Ignavibacteria bacterium RIFOXYA12_FULL_35_25]OGU96354.1 MAG: ADP-heptose--LPS heptosyltransferase [Ignavibacteria bacterium RIFOXYB12_FULL_35_14]OGV01522.1 MAG: ADP-heptose--